MNIIKYKNWFFALSLALIIPGIIAFGVFGVKLGIDFSGGTLWEVKISEADNGLNSQDFQKFLNQEGAEVSSASLTLDKSILVRMRVTDENKINQIREKVTKKFGKIEDLRLETVGPAISKELTYKALLAVGLATIAIVLYVTWSFRMVPQPTSSIAFGFCTIFALVHDILIVVGIFAILGRFFNIEVDTLFITALLTVIGFSVHDTIVVFDRIRENLKKHKDLAFESVINNSLLETMARSLNTSITAIFVLTALLLFGGATIKIFILALLIGIISGTYSSIFIAAPLLVIWNKIFK
ncbi:protein-export membrane protein SecF [Candidatus Curtissbacteria bacterium RIFCSPLOWO2_01_FULL_39_62]|uniref:Protein-export membrane protein SecF n=2 Tax=Candidatus Curtissiibacteriota TaxID=1752717 RepID=A0A1F5G8U1_9BACT|nr:MAG: protein-export membrane protein SecF [Candidatus Curtissbacteria bacterium RIFCSPHIGHO2_01_FULL_39_57]OGD88281.1 MAG: protein-export membrane protein SecF [Candidatus Curtissbacteria bacterium RIFCSPHIGHO2_02_FULL_40_16b]OGD90345.1 MAG: protein-export membrane protein SecF [Candidatus Curtissbacteria bacterium RIFCSPHIGHO2_12_FULL_38_37]OGE00069.1 MAG: protein-export membrane protein SecF [Candidatus Curtissbacteria bacterium RIFCSPLOWO2_02_FULL_40_11]OGE00583.1 MAG: protein-export memb